MVKAADILKSLPKLSDEERRAVLARCRLLADTEVVTTSATADEQLVHRDLGELLSQKGTDRIMPLSALLADARLGSKFRRGVEGVCELVDRFFQPRNRSERQKAVRLVLAFLASDLDQWGKPVTLRSICNILERAARAVDDRFPGYRASGLLPVVLRGM